MGTPRVLAIVQAGGQGTRMDVLTRERPKPALPYAGVYRLLDVPLSNVRNSGIDRVWVSAQFRSQDLADVLDGGRPWDLDRRRGGLSLVVPQTGAGAAADEGFVSGNAEELFQQRDAIRTADVDAVVVLSADHVYRLDYLDVVQRHLERDAECTVVTTKLTRRDARNHVTVIAGEDGRVREIQHKPSRARTGTVATEVFVYDPEVLVAVLEEQHHRLAQEVHAARDDGEPNGSEGDPGDGSVLGDFGEHLLPALVERGHTFTHPLQGYWRDLGRPETYLAAHRDFLAGDADLFDANWPLATATLLRDPARFAAGSRVADSLVSPGCVVEGSVLRSVLGPGVRVEAGASVRDSVVMQDVVIGAGARVDWSIVDDGCHIGERAHVGARNPEGNLDPELIALLGRDSRVAPGSKVGRGARLEPGTTA